MPPRRGTLPLYDVPPFERFSELLRRSRTEYAARPALADLNPTPMAALTHAELAQAVGRLGRALRAQGLAPRDHVAIVAENRVQWVVAYLAAISSDMVAVPIDRALPTNEVIAILHAADCRAAVFSEQLRENVLAAAAGLKDLRLLIDMDAAERTGRVQSMSALMSAVPEVGPEPLASDPDAPAVIVFTSGSMGRAKGVMLSQRNIASNIRDMLRMVELVPADRFLSVLPIHHTYECTCGVLCPLYAGASVHFARSLKTVAEDLGRVHATVLLGVPLLYEKMYRRIVAGIEEKRLRAAAMRPLKALARTGEALGARGLRRRIFRAIHDRLGGAVRILVVGGAKPDPAVARGLRALGFTMIQGYGLTETAPILALNRLDAFDDDAAGLPLPSVELRIVEPDADGRGEILARGPSVMLGYYKDPEATAAVLRDGWFATGDIGSIDANGFLHVTGRKKNLIVASNGKNVSPEELEDRLNALPFVLESVVQAVAVGHDEEIAATVVPDAEALVAHARRHDAEVTPELIERLVNEQVRALNRSLPLYKQIRHVRIRDTEFEKTTTNKIKRHLLQQEDTTH